jgi:hypothetical protein
MNLDDVGNAVLNMEQNMDEQRPQELAKYVLVLFVRGIATDLQFPLAHFASGGISADILYPIIWEALEILEVTVGLKVLFIPCDGASPNRRFFKLHQLPQHRKTCSLFLYILLLHQFHHHAIDTMQKPQCRSKLVRQVSLSCSCMQ